MVRAGFAARAITYGVVGGVALALALGAGSPGKAPNQQGALALIAQAPLGRAAILLICVGLLAYALWKLGQGVFGHGPEGGGDPRLRDRVANFGGAAVYVGFFVVALHVLGGSDSSGSQEPQQAASGVLGWPGGPVLVGAAGVAFIIISGYQIYDALCGQFADDVKTADMRPWLRQSFQVIGRIGLIARSLVFALVGYFLVKTAFDYKAYDAVGIDGALARIHQQPLGPWLLGLVAAGLLVFAAFSLLEARYRRL
jgi:Domain of Unknown Function (DUF1206)